MKIRNMYEKNLNKFIDWCDAMKDKYHSPRYEAIKTAIKLQADTIEMIKSDKEKINDYIMVLHFMLPLGLLCIFINKIWVTSLISFIYLLVYYRFYKDYKRCMDKWD